MGVVNWWTAAERLLPRVQLYRLVARFEIAHHPRPEGERWRGACPPDVSYLTVLIDNQDDPLRVAPDELIDLLVNYVPRVVGREVTLGDHVPPFHDMKSYPDAVVIVLSELVQVPQRLPLFID